MMSDPYWSFDRCTFSTILISFMCVYLFSTFQDVRNHVMTATEHTSNLGVLVVVTS